MLLISSARSRFKTQNKADSRLIGFCQERETEILCEYQNNVWRAKSAYGVDLTGVCSTYMHDIIRILEMGLSTLSLEHSRINLI